MNRLWIQEWTLEKDQQIIKIFITGILEKAEKNWENQQLTNVHRRRATCFCDIKQQHSRMRGYCKTFFLWLRDEVTGWSCLDCLIPDCSVEQWVRKEYILIFHADFQMEEDWHCSMELFMIVQIAFTYCKTNRWTHWRRTPCSIQRGEESNSTFFMMSKKCYFFQIQKLKSKSHHVVSCCCCSPLSYKVISFPRK